VSKGCNVLIADLSLRPEAQTLVSEHSQPAPNKGVAVFHRTDVTKWADLTSAFRAALAAFQVVDIVVPGAGVFEPHWSNFWYPPGSEDSTDEVESNSYKSFDINAVHPIRLTQMAVQYFVREKRAGSVVLVSSVAGQLVGPVTPIYIASKHAINGFVWSLGILEEQVGVRVTAVAPGIIKVQKSPLLTSLAPSSSPYANTFCL
jgi:3-hydroxybutyrate dehydrogenase